VKVVPRPSFRCDFDAALCRSIMPWLIARPSPTPAPMFFRSHERFEKYAAVSREQCPLRRRGTWISISSSIVTQSGLKPEIAAAGHGID